MKKFVKMFVVMLCVTMLSATILACADNKPGGMTADEAKAAYNAMTLEGSTSFIATAAGENGENKFEGLMTCKKSGNSAYIMNSQKTTMGGVTTSTKDELWYGVIENKYYKFVIDDSTTPITKSKTEMTKVDYDTDFAGEIPDIADITAPSTEIEKIVGSKDGEVVTLVVTTKAVQNTPSVEMKYEVKDNKLITANLVDSGMPMKITVGYAVETITLPTIDSSWTVTDLMGELSRDQALVAYNTMTLDGCTSMAGYVSDEDSAITSSGTIEHKKNGTRGYMKSVITFIENEVRTLRIEELWLDKIDGKYYKFEIIDNGGVVTKTKTEITQADYEFDFGNIIPATDDIKIPVNNIDTISGNKNGSTITLAVKSKVIEHQPLLDLDLEIEDNKIIRASGMQPSSQAQSNFGYAEETIDLPTTTGSEWIIAHLPVALTDAAAKTAYDAMILDGCTSMTNVVTENNDIVSKSTTKKNGSNLYTIWTTKTTDGAGVITTSKGEIWLTVIDSKYYKFEITSENGSATKKRTKTEITLEDYTLAFDNGIPTASDIKIVENDIATRTGSTNGYAVTLDVISNATLENPQKDMKFEIVNNKIVKATRTESVIINALNFDYAEETIDLPTIDSSWEVIDLLVTLTGEQARAAYDAMTLVGCTSIRGNSDVSMSGDTSKMTMEHKIDGFSSYSLTDIHATIDGKITNSKTQTWYSKEDGKYYKYTSSKENDATQKKREEITEATYNAEYRTVIKTADDVRALIGTIETISGSQRGDVVTLVVKTKASEQAPSMDVVLEIVDNKIIKETVTMAGVTEEANFGYAVENIMKPPVDDSWTIIDLQPVKP